MAEKNKKINNLIDSSVLTLNDIADVDTVIGKPIVTASGFQVIPFSKVTMGCLSGGGEYGDVKVVKETDSMPFAGGSGSVVSMKPMGFIIDDGKTCRMIRITDEPIDNLIEKASEIVQEYHRQGLSMSTAEYLAEAEKRPRRFRFLCGFLSAAYCVCLLSPAGYAWAKAENKKTSVPPAQAECVMEANSRRILYESNGAAQLPMASTTKILTAITVLENSADIKEKFEISLQ